MRQWVASQPTTFFTAGVILVPLIYIEGWQNMLGYLLQPSWVASCVLLLVILRATHTGGSRELTVRDQRVANWFLCNGVYFNLFLDVISGQFQASGEMSKQYLKVEPRYHYGPFVCEGQSVFWTSMIELLLQAPLCIACYVAYHRGFPWRRQCEIVVSLLHAVGVWYFYIPEAVAGFPHLGGWPLTVAEAFSFERLLFFWFGFWFCGILWIVAPFFIAQTAWSQLSDIVSNSTEQILCKKDMSKSK